MKKYYIVLIVSVLTFFGTQRVYSQSFNAGLIAGAAFSQVDGDHYGGFHQLGWTLGAYVNLPFNDYLSGQMELKYSLLGARSSVTEVVDYGYNVYDLRLHYAEIPLMLRYNLGSFKISGRTLDFISLEAGVGLDFRMKATEDVNGDFQVTTQRWNFFSATGNAGVHFAITNHWGFGARFMYSIVPIRFNPDSPNIFYGHYYNKVWQATVTYNFKSPLK